MRAALAFTARLFGELGFTVVPWHRELRVRRHQARCAHVPGGLPRARRDGGAPVRFRFTTWTRVSIGTLDEMQRAATVFRNILGGVPSAAAR